METATGALLARLHDAKPRELHLQHQLLRGGLETAIIARVMARYRDAIGRPPVFTLGSD